MLGWLLSVLGPLLLTGASVLTGRSLGLPSVLLLQVALTVAVALVGGLRPAVTAAVLGSLLINVALTPPYYTVVITTPENALALLICVVVGITVSSVVDLAARQGVRAQRAAADAELLGLLAQSVVRGGDTVAAILDQLRTRFGLDAVSLLERTAPDAPWRLVHRSPRPGVADDTDRGAGPETEVSVTPTVVLRVHGRPLPPTAGRIPAAFAAQAVAVLERERLRDRVRQAQVAAEGDAVRRALLTAVSHDLRTPLAAIKAAADSLQQSDVQWTRDDRSALVDTIAGSTARLQRLIDNLLDLSRLQSGGTHALIRPVSLDEVVLPALDGLPADRIDLDLDESLPLVSTDPGLLERALANIAQNAVAYSPADRSVLVDARLVAAPTAPETGYPAGFASGPSRQDNPYGPHGRMEIRVVDHGPGVPAAGRSVMFQPFQRLGDAPAGTGLGLGLAVARGFLDAVGATLVATDTPGGGLTMVVTVPLAVPSAGAGRADRPVTPGEQRGDRR